MLRKATHQVFNQSAPLANYNVFLSDPSLQLALSHWGGADYAQHAGLLRAQGAHCGSAETIAHSETADRHRPALHRFDRYGHSLDVVEYSPSYHALMSHALRTGVPAHGFNSPLEGSHVVRAALTYMENQTEAGHSCPLTMTFSAIPALKDIPGYEGWVEKIKHQDYDPRNVPVSEKACATIGMSMTEKQGGSDVRMNTTAAAPLHAGPHQSGKEYLLTGHKWFTSAPMCDAFLTLAKLDESSPPSCFLVPRWKPDGSRNTGFRVMRLKDKLGDHANASSEVEYDEAYGTLIGAPGKGVKTIIQMVQGTRLDCVLGSAGTARRALHLAINHAVSGREGLHSIV
jgi:putative acyl-CoA dehydrogenase